MKIKGLFATLGCFVDRAIHCSVWTRTGPKTGLDRNGPCIIGPVHGPVLFQFRFSVRSQSRPVDRSVLGIFFLGNFSVLKIKT